MIISGHYYLFCQHRLQLYSESAVLLSSVFLTREKKENSYRCQDVQEIHNVFSYPLYLARCLADFRMKYIEK